MMTEELGGHTLFPACTPWFLVAHVHSTGASPIPDAHSVAPGGAYLRWFMGCADLQHIVWFPPSGGSAWHYDQMYLPIIIEINKTFRRCVYVCMHVSMYVFMDDCIHVRTYTYMRACMCTYVHIHACTYVGNRISIYVTAESDLASSKHRKK